MPAPRGRRWACALDQVTDRKELAELAVTGCDGLADGERRLVVVRTLAATVITPPNTGPAVKLLGQFRRSPQPLPVETLLTPVSYPPESVLEGRRRPG